MNPRYTIIFIILIILIGAGVYFFIQHQQTLPAPVGSDITLEAPTENSVVVEMVMATTTATTTATTSVSAPSVATSTTKATTSVARTPVTHDVTIASFAFSPKTLTVKAGDTVVWTNQDGAPHQIVGTGITSSAVLGKGVSYSYTFTSVGTFDYKCGLHPSMLGQVIVK